MLDSLRAAWRALQQRRQARAAAALAATGPQPGDSARVLQLFILRRLEPHGEAWTDAQVLGIDGAAWPLLDAVEQLADHGFITAALARRDDGHAMVVALKLLPKGARFIAAYAAPAQPTAPISTVPPRTC